MRATILISNSKEDLRLIFTRHFNKDMLLLLMKIKEEYYIFKNLFGKSFYYIKDSSKH